MYLQTTPMLPYRQNFRANSFNVYQCIMLFEESSEASEESYLVYEGGQ